MEKDRYAVIWTQINGDPVKMANIISTGREFRFSYTQDYLNTGSTTGVSIFSSPDIFEDKPIVHTASEAMPLYPRLMSLIPGQGKKNIQRRIYNNILAKYDTPPAPGFDTEWALLMMAGRNGIGHIDIFETDFEAQQWYEEKQKPLLQSDESELRSTIWQFLKEDLSMALPEDIDLVNLLGPTPSVGGMIPKILATIPDLPNWNGDFERPGLQHIDGHKSVEVIIKIEYPEYAGLTQLEALGLEANKKSGVITPRYWLANIDDLPMIAIERFDRTQKGTPIPIESFFSAMASATTDVTGATDTDMERVGRMLAAIGKVAKFDVKTSQKSVYQRFLLAILTGNGDMHLENLSFIGGNDGLSVSPMYDPAPMRAWSRHNLLSAIPFEIEGSLRDSIIRLGKSFGLNKKIATELLHQCAESTDNFQEQVLSETNVPHETQKRLVSVISDVRKKLGVVG